MKKIIIIGQMRNKPFLIVIYHSSLVKAVMNSARVCKLRNGVNKTPQFLLFSMAEGGTKTIYIKLLCSVNFFNQKLFFQNLSYFVCLVVMERDLAG
jgi:hypothetical protein